jgi:chemotaxis protein MotA
MMTATIGVAILTVVGKVALSERAEAKLGFIDYHAAIVVFGGVIGALFLAIDHKALITMLRSVLELFPNRGPFSQEMKKTYDGFINMRDAWREGRRSTVLSLADQGETLELRVSADALLKQLDGPGLAERFMEVRAKYLQTYGPVIEGWEMVGKLAPSFGMVGTVTGMVQLFRTMGEGTGNLGGSLAMALLATLYGIASGAAIGGPMASRVNNQLNERLTQLDLMEKTVAALVRESRGHGSHHAGH